MLIRTEIQDFHNGEVRKSVRVEDVLMFQAEQKYVMCYYRGGEILMRDTMASLSKEFPEKFVRVHRSRLVARRLIKNPHLTHNGPAMSIDGLHDPVLVARRQMHVVDAVLLERGTPHALS